MSLKPLKPKKGKPCRVGILGGMGPLASAHFQKLIIEVTPAKRDQDHIQAVCFTNPQIPDRTLSLLSDNGQKYLAAIKESIQILERCDIDIFAIPCNTAHARFKEIQILTSTPFVNMIEAAVSKFTASFPDNKFVGLLATEGTITANLYQEAFLPFGIRCIVPDFADQKVVSEIIYKIKRGSYKNAIHKLCMIIDEFREKGTGSAILGCTELSLCYKALTRRGYSVFDPLRALAERVVELAREG